MTLPQVLYAPEGGQYRSRMDAKRVKDSQVTSSEKGVIFHCTSVHLPKMHVTAVRPSVADDTKTARRHLKDLCSIVMLEAVVQHVLNPYPSLRFRSLVHAQPAATAIRLEGIVLTDDDFELPIAVQIGHVERVR